MLNKGRYYDVLIAFNLSLKYVAERGTVRLIFCESHTYRCVTFIDSTMTVCGIVETCLKDVFYHSMLDITGM